MEASSKQILSAMLWKKEFIIFSPKQDGAFSHSKSTSKEAVTRKQELCVH